jgi:hypothetical protein
MQQPNSDVLANVTPHLYFRLEKFFCVFYDKIRNQSCPPSGKQGELKELLRCLHRVRSAVVLVPAACHTSRSNFASLMDATTPFTHLEVLPCKHGVRGQRHRDSTATS